MAFKRTNIDAADVIDLYLSGENELSLSRRFECGRTVIARILREHHIPKHSMTDIQRALNAARTPECRAQMAEAAQIARRGQRDTIETRRQRAQTRQAKQLGVSPAELLLREWLLQRDIDATPQLAIGHYNADLGAFPVAVEVFGGGWHGSGRHAARTPERCRYILDAGWNLVIIWVDGRRWPLKPAAADYLATFVEQSRRDPSFRRQYRVIWGDGQAAPVDCLNVEDLARMPSVHHRFD